MQPVGWGKFIVPASLEHREKLVNVLLVIRRTGAS
jgi:hypothetical protein